MPPSEPASSPAGWTPPSVFELDAVLPPQYRVREVIGQGGMGAVYRATQTGLDRDVAIKILPLHESTGGTPGAETTGVDTADLQFAERFKLEAKSMAALNHPGILSVYDFGETEEGLLYFVMEYSDGTDVGAYLRDQGGRLPEEQALTITAHVLDALAYAHVRGIAHRDIKPANILLTSEGQVKIADFGLAKRTDPGAGAGLTRTNLTMGTPDFVAPEALTEGVETDHRVDLYAVGVMLYQMLTGELPRGSWKAPSTKVPNLDRRIDALVDKAMEADPASRYQSAAEMRAAIDAITFAPVAVLEPGAPSSAIPVKKAPAPSTTPPAERSPALIAAAVAGAVGILALIAWLIFKPSPAPAPEPEITVASTKPLSEATTPEPRTRDDSPRGNLRPGLKGKGKEKDGSKKGSRAPAAKGRPTPSPAPQRPEPPVPAKATPKPAPLPTTPVPAPAPDPEPPAPIDPPEIAELATRHTNYQAALEEKLTSLETSYTGAITRALDTAAAAGDLNTAAAFRDESQRLEEKKPLPPEDPAGTALELATLRNTYRTERAKIESALAADFDKSLRALEVALTQEKRIDDALAVQTWRESLAPPEPAPAPAPEPPGIVNTPPTENREPGTENGDEVAPGILRGTGTLSVAGNKHAPLDLSAVAGFSDIVDVVANNRGWLALRANGDAIGRSNGKPLAASGIARIRAGTGYSEYLAITAEGAVFRISIVDLSPSEPTIPGTGFVDAAGGFDHSLALHSSGRVTVFGKIYDEGERERPPAEALEDIVAIAANRMYAATLSADGGTLHIWGGDPNNSRYAAVELERRDRLQAIYSGPHRWSFTGLTTDGELRFIVAEDGKWKLEKPQGRDPRGLAPQDVVVGGNLPRVAVREDGHWRSLAPESDAISGELAAIEALGEDVTRLAFQSEAEQGATHPAGFALWIEPARNPSPP